jgi:hypothetical protein
MKLTAKFLKLLTPQTGSSSNGNWIKQDFVVETKETYPKKVVLASWNNQYDITNLQVDTYYDFELLLESKAFNGNYYPSAVLIDQPQPMQMGLASLVSGFKLFQIKVKIVSISSEIQGSSWTKQEVIFEPIEQGYKSLSAIVINKKVDLTSFSESDEVCLDFFIESREYNQKWYTDFKVWKMELIKKGSSRGNQTYNLSDPDSWPF